MDENRIKKMVHLAMYEQYDGKEDIEISHYHQGDYIGMGLLKNIVLITIAYIIILAFIILYNFEMIAVSFSYINIQNIIIGILICYALIIGIFSVIVFVKRKLRYNKAVIRINSYYGKLKEMDDIYKLDSLINKKEK